MKNLLLLIFLFSLPFSAQSQNRGIKNFYHKYKKYENTQNFVLPGFLVWLSTGIANEMVEDPEAKIVLKFARKCKTMRLLTMEDANSVSKEDYQKLVSSAKKGDYEELISVKDKGTKVHIMGRGKRGKFKNLLILVSEDDSFTMVNMKTNIKVKDVNRMINDLMELEKVRKKLKKKDQEDKPIPLVKPTEKKKKARA